MSRLRLVRPAGYAEALAAEHREAVRFYTRAIQDAERRLEQMDRPSVEWSQLRLVANCDQLVLTALLEIGVKANERAKHDRHGLPQTPLDAV